jgi:F-type H+-transporting ATPase subunit delta
LSLQTVARRYALALADVAIERKEEREVQLEVDSWVSMIESNPQLREVFVNPTIPYDQKRKVLEALVSRTKVRQTTSNFLEVLLKNQRLSQLKEVAERFGHVLDERRGLVAATVITARLISEESKKALQDALSSATGKTVRLNFTTDEGLIGGIVTHIGSTIFDGSVRSQLERLAVELAGKSVKPLT